MKFLKKYGHKLEIENVRIIKIEDQELLEICNEFVKEEICKYNGETKKRINTRGRT